MTKQKIRIMGILNTTPDSFSDGGLYLKPEDAVKRADQMLAEGAEIIDIGGESTRPGSEKISAAEEIARVTPVIKAIKKQFPKAVLSIDTWKHEVAEEAVKNGCTIINSLGGFSKDGNLVNIVVKSDCQIVIYHIKGDPSTMQKGQIMYTDVVREITDFFTEQLTFGKTHGVKKDQFILDPGIGFGKTLEHNLEIIKRLSEFKKFSLPIAIGLSRKSHLGMILEKDLGLKTSPLERVEAGLAETSIAVQNGATIIRIHDILQTKKFLTVLEKFL
jgi:dihydropteroate synthase